jgi:hypothetical protein
MLIFEKSLATLKHGWPKAFTVEIKNRQLRGEGNSSFRRAVVNYLNFFFSKQICLQLQFGMLIIFVVPAQFFF